MQPKLSRFAKLGFLSILCVSLSGCTLTQKPDNRRNKPNVILVFLDDSGYGDYSHHGNPTIATPNISMMAQRGVSFSQFYTSSPACSASRYSLLTGRVPGRSGLGKWVVGPNDEKYIHPRELTLAEGLQQQGYATGMFGKWHLGNPNEKNNFTTDSLPLAHGFEQWIGTNVSHDYPNAKLLSNIEQGKDFAPGYQVLAADLPSDIETSDKLTQIYTERAIAFIEQNKAQPFFAYISYNQPHLGLHVSDEFKGKSRRGKLGDVMAEVDHAIGRLLTKLEHEGIAENTLVIFSSDNGPWLKFQHQRHHRYGDTRLDIGYAMPFRDGKGSNWEGGHRVPGIFYWPSQLNGRTEQAPASTLDVLPTVFSLTGVPLPVDRSIDGRDLSSVLTNSEYQEEVPYLMSYAGRLNEVTALRHGPWKLLTSTYSQLGLDYGFDASKNGPFLFQVEQDLSESINRAAEKPDLRRHMLLKLKQLQQDIEKEGSFWDHDK